MLLLCPLNELFHEKTGSTMPGLEGCPYTIVVHAIRDSKSTIVSALRLVESADGDDSARLEVVYDDRRLQHVPKADYRLLIEELLEYCPNGSVKIRPTSLGSGGSTSEWSGTSSSSTLNDLERGPKESAIGGKDLAKQLSHAHSITNTHPAA